MTEVLELTMEFGLYGGLYKLLPGALWRATLVDRVVGQRYAGSDDCPWKAIAWALDERAHRRAGLVRMTKSGEPTMVVR